MKNTKTVIGFGAAMIGLASSARGGDPIAVNRADDAPAVNASLGPDSDPLTPGDQVSLRSAIQHINTLPAGGTYAVELNAGRTYALTVRGHAEQFAAAGDLDVRRNTIVRSASGATVDASGLGDRVFDVVGPVLLRLDRIRVSGGTAVPGVMGVETGGGIRSVAGSIVEFVAGGAVQQCSATGGPEAHGGGIDAGGDLLLPFETDPGFSVVECYAEGDGGGIRVAGSLVIDRRQLHMSRCEAGRNGGGIHASGTVDIRGRSDVFPAEFVRSRASGSGGGLFLAPDAGPMDAEFLLFKFCSADSGGAMALHAAATITGTTTESNSARDGASLWIAGDVSLHRVLSRYEIAFERGGSAYIDEGGTLQIADSRIEDNEAGLSAGSIFVGPGASLNVSRSTIHDGFVTERGANIVNLGTTRLDASRVVSGRFTGDGAGEGGGVYNAGSFVAINSFISYNGFRSRRGGALFNTGDAYLVHCNLLENTGESGSLVNNLGTLGMSHCVVRASPTGSTVAGLSIDSTGWNLDVDGSAALSGPGDRAGTPLEPADPVFTGFVFPLADSLPVLPLSPCLDAGDPSGSVDEQGRPILTDFSGNPRAIGMPDIGMTETCTTDFAQPTGTLNFFDVSGFLQAWQQGLAGADFAEPQGSFDFFDIAAFLARFADGC